MNLRCDNRFVEDEGWSASADRYADFPREHQGKKTVFLEAGTAWITPSDVKFSLW